MSKSGINLQIQLLIRQTVFSNGLAFFYKSNLISAFSKKTPKAHFSKLLLIPLFLFHWS